MTLEQMKAQMAELEAKIKGFNAAIDTEEQQLKNTVAAAGKEAAEVKPAAPATSLFFKLGAFFASSQKTVVEATETTTQAVKDGYNYSVAAVEEAANDLVAGYKGTSK